MNIFYLLPVFFFASILFSMLGIGGGVLYTPLQVFLGIPVHQAVTTSLFIIFFSAFSASVVYGKNRKIDLKLALILEISTASGAFLAGYFSKLVPEKFIVALFAFVMLLVANFMIRGENQTLKVDKRKYPKWTILWHRRFGDEEYVVPLLIAIPISGIAGVVASLCGIAGGTVKIPLMVLLFGVPMDIAVGTSSLMITLTAFFGFWGHFLTGNFRFWAIPLAAAVILGGNLGARISIRVSRDNLRKIFGYFLLLVAILMMVKSYSLWK